MPIRREHRFFVEDALYPGARVVLPEGQSRQITGVFRLGRNDKVRLFNGDGTDYEATIVLPRKDRLELDVAEGEPSRPEPRPAIDLHMALIRADPFDLVIQKATELGVARIVPVLTERCVVSFPTGRTAQKAERWRRIAIEAAEQSGRARIPEVELVLDLASALERDRDMPTLLLWEYERATTLAQALPPQADSLRIVVGPEGGLTPAEVEMARAQGAQPVTLGPLTLRAETAALAAIAGTLALASARD